jgi:hypothetical protein
MQGKLVHQSSMQEILDQGTLEQYFLSMAGTESMGANRLNWLDS